MFCLSGLLRLPESPKKEMELKVADANQQNFGKGVARISTDSMKKLGISRGDIIEIEGSDKIAGIAVEGYSQDKGLDIIRIDGLKRNNAGTSIGDRVRIRKANVGEAKKVTANTQIELKPEFEEVEEGEKYVGVTYEDIGGLEEIKQTMSEIIELPLKTPDAFRRIGIEPPRGVLLYGPPGTGKTLMAKAIANESNANFITAKGSDLLSVKGSLLVSGCPAHLDLYSTL